MYFVEKSCANYDVDLLDKITAVCVQDDFDENDLGYSIFSNHPDLGSAVLFKGLRNQKRLTEKAP